MSYQKGNKFDIQPLPRHVKRYGGELLSMDETAILDDAEAKITAMQATFPEGGKALQKIHEGLWRATDETWELYLMRRWKFTPRMAAYIMVASGSIRGEGIVWGAAGHKTLHDHDLIADAVTAALADSGNATTFYGEQAVGYLRAAREIVLTRLAPLHPGLLDWHPWLHGLKDIALALQRGVKHVREGTQPQETSDG